MGKQRRCSGSSRTKFVRTPISRIVVGKTVWRNSIGTWMGKRYRIGECLFCSSKTRIVLIGIRGWHQNGRKESEYGFHAEEIYEKRSSWWTLIISWWNLMNPQVNEWNPFHPKSRRPHCRQRIYFDAPLQFGAQVNSCATSDENSGCEKLEPIKSKKEVILEAQRDKKKVHVATLMDVCLLKKCGMRSKNTEVERQSRAPWWHCKRRLWSLCSFLLNRARLRPEWLPQK